MKDNSSENSSVVMEEKATERKSFVENSPLYSRMSMICHVVIFLYAASFWIQVGVFPVSLLNSCLQREYHTCYDSTCQRSWV